MQNQICREFFSSLLARFPASRNRLAEKESRHVNKLEHVLIAKLLRTLAGQALVVVRVLAAFKPFQVFR